jgi:excisionase family DNA binding protein
MEGSNRVTVQEAARLLGISEGAIRARIHRGSLETEREGGTVYVRLDADDTSNQRTEQSELVQTLREYNTSLERQLNAERQASAELRRIIAALTQRIPPQLEAPSERPETATEGTDRGTVSKEPREPAEPRSWWSRVFGSGG